MKNYAQNGVSIIRDKNTKEPIAIKWTFDNGQTSIVYPDDKNDDWFVTMVKEITNENNADRRQREHIAVSLDDVKYEGDWFADKSILPMNEYLNIQEEEERVHAFAETLNEINKRRFLLRYQDPTLSYQDIADIEGTSKVAIFKSFKTISKKYLEFFGI